MNERNLQKGQNPGNLESHIVHSLTNMTFSGPQVSLELASVLLEQGGLPAGQPLDYFLHMLVALLDCLAEGFNECEG